MENFIVVLLLLTIVGLASYKIYKDKKNNVICSGCTLCKSKSDCKGYIDNSQKGLL